MKGFVNNLNSIQPAAVFDIQLKSIVYQKWSIGLATVFIKIL